MAKILITGADGLLGFAFRSIQNQYSHDFYFVSRKDGDLTNPEAVQYIYSQAKPEWVIHAAAMVGGIALNRLRPAELFYENILMNSHMIHYAQVFKVKRLICCSSICSFPDSTSNFREDQQQEGAPYKDNFAYGYAKRMVDIQLQAYRQQYEVNYFSIIPTNMYGPNDNFSLSDGHVIASLIHKCYLAKKNKKTMTIWGDGSPLREFIYAEDVAHLALWLLNNNKYDKMIISNGMEISIKDVCSIICDSIKFEGPLIFDSSKPIGQFRKSSDISRLRECVSDLNFMTYSHGIKKTVDWFVKNYPNLRM